MRDIIMRNLESREFRVQVNWRSFRRQVQFPIQHVLALIQGLLILIRQVVPLISHIRSNPPHCSHLHPPSLTSLSTTLPSSENSILSHYSLSLHVMIMSWHQVQYTPSTVYTQDCSCSLHFHDYELTSEGSFRFQRSSLHSQLPSGTSQLEVKGKVALSYSDGCEWTNWGKVSGQPSCRPSTAHLDPTNVAGLLPTCSHTHGPQVHLHTCPITLLECVSNLTRSWPPTVSPNMLDYTLQRHIQTRSIPASKCISKLAKLQSPNSLNHGLQVYR